MSEWPSPVRVLHVDDEPDFAETAAAFLEREDDRFVVETAADTEEGLRRLAAGSFDCVVSDYDMPDTDGIAFLKAVREDHPEVPFILFTGKGSEEVASDAISRGVTDYLQKTGGTDQYTILANRIRNAVERTQAERRRRRSERRFEAVFEDPNMLVGVLDADGTLRRVNGSAMEFVEADREAVTGEPFWETPWWDDARAEDIREWIERAASGEYVEFEAVHTTPDGDRRNVYGTVRPVTDGGGEVVSLVASAQDITERKRQARKLGRTNRRLQAVLDTAATSIVIKDDEGRYQLMNRTAKETFGFDPEEDVTGLTDEDVFPDEFAERYWADDRRVLETGAAIETEEEVPTPSGTRTHLTLRSPLFDDEGHPDGVCAVSTDITDRKEREEALQRERNRRSALFEELGEPAVEVTFDDGAAIVQNVNDAFEAVFGIEEGELVGDSLNHHIVPEGERDDARKLNEQVETGEPVERELERRTADGLRSFLLRTVPFTVDDERRAYAIYLDITDRKRQQERFEAFLEHSGDAITVLDPDGTYIYQSPSAERVFGYEPGELVGENAFEYIHPDDQADVRESFEMAVDNPELTPTAEFRFRHGDGSWIWVESVGNNQLSNPAIEGFVVNSRDVTERKNYEQRLERHVERLEEFASVVSHDLRNPLNVAQGRLELAREDGSGDDHLERAAAAIDRSLSLVDDLLTLAREGRRVDELEAVSLGTAARESWWNVETGDATLTVEAERTVRADPSRLRQLLANLFRNAVEHGGERVTVTVGALPDGFYLADDGAGFPDWERDPTLDAGDLTAAEGDGFGLSIVHRIVDAHGWQLTVTESDDGGARFDVTGVADD